MNSPETASLSSETMKYSSDEEKLYDMNVLEEYESLFGDPMKHNVEKILKNVTDLCWPKEEIVDLLEELLVLYYENVSSKVEKTEIDLWFIKITKTLDFINTMSEL